MKNKELLTKVMTILFKERNASKAKTLFDRMSTLDRKIKELEKLKRGCELYKKDKCYSQLHFNTIETIIPFDVEIEYFLEELLDFTEIELELLKKEFESYKIEIK